MASFGATLSGYREEADGQMVRGHRGNIQTLVDPLIAPVIEISQYLHTV